MLLRIALCIALVIAVTVHADNCAVCEKATQYLGTIKGMTMDTARVKFESIFKTFPSGDQSFLQNLARYNFRKLYLDVNKPIKGMSTLTTCADLGYCSDAKQFQPTGFHIDDMSAKWLPYTDIKDIRDKTIIVVHDTVTETLQETLTALWDRKLSVQYVLDKDGKVYKLVEDHRRAWHAGSGIWRGDGCQVDDTNTRSVGIETVNNGAEPYPPAQVKGLHRLIEYLQQKWHVDAQNIIAHHENSANYKVDISGYFSWKGLYDEMGMWNKALWETKLTPKQQKEVVLSDKVHNAALLKEVQDKLFDYGYGTIVKGSPYTSGGTVTTQEAIESFNRKWCPEVFIKESIQNGKLITHPENTQVYKLTLERLTYVSSHNKREECWNY